MILAIPVIVLVMAPVLSSAIKAQGHFIPMDGHQADNIDGNRWYSTYLRYVLRYLRRQNTKSIPRQERNYEDDSIDATETVDLHKGEFCVECKNKCLISDDNSFPALPNPAAPRVPVPYPTPALTSNTYKTAVDNNVLRPKPIFGFHFRPYLFRPYFRP